MRCPLCGRLETGRVASEQYFCWHCCVEFHGTPGNWRVFQVDEDGNLVDAGLADVRQVAAPPREAEAVLGAVASGG